MKLYRKTLPSLKWVFKGLTFKGYLSLALYVILGFFQGVSILILIPMLSITGIADSEVANENKLIQNAKYYLDYFNLTISFRNVLIIFVCIILLYSLITYSSKILNSKLVQGFASKLRKELHHSYIETEWINISKIKSSDLLGLISRETIRIATALTVLTELIGTIILLIFQIGIAFLISPEITFCVIGSSLFLGILIRKLLFSSLQNGIRSISYSETLQSNLIGYFQNFKLAKSQNLNSKQKILLEQLSDDIYNNRVQFEKDRAKLSLITDIGSAIFLSVFLYFGFVVYSKSILDLILLIVIFSRIAPGVQSSLRNTQTLFNLMPIIDEIRNKIQDFKNNKEDIGNKEIHKYKLNKQIEISAIYFKYKDKDLILENVSLTIKKNSVIAITGESGSGKTTLVDIITGLLKPTSGNIMIDGKSLKEIGYNNWRSNIAYMTQEPILFNDTIRNNILWSNPQATEEDIWNALDFANVKEYVASLDLGIDTYVGDRGTRFSGGQRQRIALARTLVRKPTLLILDEATNELDENNEYEIIEN
ncbi:MAG: ABC transporter ATP-binding protein, partial [Candidatus Sericytochromatia bacterium]|nr:ABC transporter ATP-binding protein [Candidatus Sericytochromatia bacterium]